MFFQTSDSWRLNPDSCQSTDMFCHANVSSGDMGFVCPDCVYLMEQLVLQQLEVRTVWTSSAHSYLGALPRGGTWVEGERSRCHSCPLLVVSARVKVTETWSLPQPGAGSNNGTVSELVIGSKATRQMNMRRCGMVLIYRYVNVFLCVRIYGTILRKIKHLGLHIQLRGLVGKEGQ